MDTIIKIKKKKYIAPDIEIVEFASNGLMQTASVEVPWQPGEGVENPTKKNNGLFSFYGDDEEDDLFNVYTDVENEGPDAIDEIINRLR